MDNSELRELFDLMAERNITEFELEKEGVKVRVKKGVPVINGEESAAPLAAPAVVVPAPATAAASAPTTPEPVAPSDEGLAIVKAPMVGTFYRQSAPGAEPFVNVGDRVTKGQTLCIIEAMKLMNEIESEGQGEIAEVYVEDGQAVGFGERLFAIRED